MRAPAPGTTGARILELLAGRGEARTDGIAAALGLEVEGVTGPLARLLLAGRVARRQVLDDVTGRPRWLYRLG